jgi:hypothetical protein
MLTLCKQDYIIGDGMMFIAIFMKIGQMGRVHIRELQYHIQTIL